jgi:uncharacterized protein YndB with AHSA1/START domain
VVIQKTTVLHAPLERVWTALSDARRFGVWFGMRFDGPFVAGQPISGRIEPTAVDPEVAKLQQPHAGKWFEFDVDRIEPMHHISFRWHPFAIDAARDYSHERKTLIVFEIEPVLRDTRLTITESGFEHIPPDRRDQAMRANEEGWTHQLKLVAKYLALHA